MKIDNKEQFKLNKELLKIEADNDKKKHEFHIEELNMQMEIEKAKFDFSLQLQRIKSAEIRKTIESKNTMQWDGYPPK
jgi:hypothetical protein